MSNNNDAFGEAKFGGSQRHTHKFPKEGGTLVLRILPPVGSLKDSGRWSQYFAIHFGYRDTKGKLKPFQSCEKKNRQTKMIEVVDPAQERITKMKILMDKAKAEDNKDMMKRISEQLQIFNVKKSHYVNAMDLTGKIGIFSIGIRAKQALDEEIKKLQARGINPLSVEDGRYFAFTRSGTGNQTTYSVAVYQEEMNINGVKAFVEKTSRLTPDVGSRVLSEGADLPKLYISPTPEEIADIVKNEGGQVLENVFAKYKAKTSSAAVEEEVEDTEDDVQAPVVAPSNTAAMQTKTEVAPPVAEAPKAQAQEATAPAQTQGIAGLSDEEFRKLMGL